MKHRTFMIERDLPMCGYNKVYYGGMDRAGDKFVPYWTDKEKGIKYADVDLLKAHFKRLKDEFGFLNMELHIIELPEKVKQTERVKKLIKWVKENGYEGMQTFDCRNIVGDRMETVYEADEITVDYCEGWEYFEIFGLTGEEYESLRGTLDI